MIFSCILLEITTLQKWNHGGASITIADSFEATKVIEMITRLRRAAETLQRFGQGTRSSKRIRRTLVKLVQICMTLAQFSPEHGPVILSALSSNQQSDAQQEFAVQMQMQGQGENGMQQEAVGGVGAPGAMDDPFTMFDMSMPQYWTDTNLDLFTDLVGVETGLTAMLSG